MLKPDIILHTLDISYLMQLLKIDNIPVDVFINRALDEYQICETDVRCDGYLEHQERERVTNAVEAFTTFYKQVINIVSKNYRVTPKYSRYPQVSHLRRGQNLFLIVKYY